MRLSTRSTYGMRALVELAMGSGHSPVSASMIASRQNLSVAYLEQLLHRLRKDGLVASVRGPKGGYILAKEARSITMADVVRILEGRPRVLAGKEKGAWRRRGAGAGGPANGKGRTPQRRTSRGASPTRQAEHIAQTVWHYVQARLVQSLESITLQDLCDEVLAQDGEPLDHPYVFHI